MMKIKAEAYGKMPAGDEVMLFTLSNDAGMEVGIIDYGGIITSIKVAGRDRRFEDVVLGLGTLEAYLQRSRYFGATIGRHANRIARGKFVLDGVEYSLSINDGENHLHGGGQGFDKVVWQPEIEHGLRLNYFSPDGEQGYPGNLRATVTFFLSEANELRIDYQATTDQATIVNLTNHSYFNLAGGGSILDHELKIEADSFTPCCKGLIPTGEIRKVGGTPMDFTSATPIGARIDAVDEQLQLAGGYDHNFVLRSGGGDLHQAATVYDPQTGRMLEIFTTEPGMQFYSGNFLDGSIIGRDGRGYQRHSGFCLEPQHFPGAPNHPNFPSTVLRPGEQYRQTSVYRFSVA